MSICNHCGKTIDTLPFKCKFCKMEYCPQCRLPETHNCSALFDYKLYMHTKFRKNASELVNKHYKTYDGDYEVIVDRQNHKQTTRENKYNAPSKVMKKYAIEKPFDEANRKRSSARSIKIKYLFSWLNKQSYPRHSEMGSISDLIIFICMYSVIFYAFYAFIYKNEVIQDVFRNIGFGYIFIILFVIGWIALIMLILELLKDIWWWFGYAKRWKRYIVIILLIFVVMQIYQSESVIDDFTGDSHAIMTAMASSMMANTYPFFESPDTQEFNQRQPRVLTKQESKIAFEYVNQLRSQYNRRLLEWDDRAYELAVSRSKDMYVRDYFDHVTPEGTCAKDLKYEFGFNSEDVLAENLGGVTHYSNGVPVLGASVNDSVDGWMNSRGHRYNLLYGDHIAGAIGCYEYICAFYGINHDPYGLGAGPCSTGEEGLAYWKDVSKQPGEA